MSLTSLPPRGGDLKVRARPFVSAAVLYAAGYGAYMIAVQLVAMGLANRRFPKDEFGGFAVLYSFTMFFAAIASRWLQHLVIRSHPGGHDPGASYWHWFKWTWLKGGAGIALAGALAVWALAKAVGIAEAMPPTVAAVTSFALCFGHVLFEGLVGTAARIRRRFAGLAVAFFLYAMFAAGLAWVARTAVGFMAAFVVAASVSTLLYVAYDARGWRRPTEPAGTDSSAGWIASAGGLQVAVFAAMSLAVRYLDRPLVGHFAGAAVAGEFFALNAGVMATLLPVGMLGPILHGWIAQWRDLPRRGMQGTGWLWMWVVVPIAVLAVSPVARLTITLVYPSVDLPALGISWYVFCLGRVLLVSRDLSEPFVSRFGSLRALPVMDASLLLALAGGMALTRTHLSLDLVNLLSGTSLAAAGVAGLGALMATVWSRRATT